MKLDNLVELLACVPLFEGLTHEQLTRLAFEGEKVLIHSERPIISKDQPGDAAYLIVEGKCLRVSGPGIEGQPEVLSAGTFIGEMAMLIASHYGSTIVAYGEVKALRFSYVQMQRIMEDDPSIAAHFAEHVQSKFLSFTNQLKELRDGMFNDDAEDTIPVVGGGNLASLSRAGLSPSQSLQ